MKSRRGRFSISRRLIDDVPKAALAILSGCVVVRAECMWDTEIVEYTAFGEHFEVVADYNMTPCYRPVVKDLVGGKYAVTWEKIAQ